MSEWALKIKTDENLRNQKISLFMIHPHKFFVQLEQHSVVGVRSEERDDHHDPRWCWYELLAKFSPLILAVIGFSSSRKMLRSWSLWVLVCLESTIFLGVEPAKVTQIRALMTLTMSTQRLFSICSRGKASLFSSEKCEKIFLMIHFICDFYMLEEVQTETPSQSVVQSARWWREESSIM